MKKGDYAETPRFLKVKIDEVFETLEAAREQGFHEGTDYRGEEFRILGKRIGTNQMIFAAARR
jgi:hypothetical protein